MLRIVVDIQGGCVTEVYTSEPAEVILVDWDDLNCLDAADAERDVFSRGALESSHDPELNGETITGTIHRYVAKGILQPHLGS